MKEDKNKLVHKFSRLDEATDDSNPTEFTDIIGGNGKWQLRIFLISTLAAIPSAWNHLGMSFFAFPQDHWCAQPLVSNETLQEWWHDDLPNSTVQGRSQHSQCEMYVRNRTSDGTVLVTTTPCTSWEFAPGYKSITEEWNLVCSDEWEISTSQSVYMLGFLFAGILSGQMSDLYGRFPTIIFLGAISIVAGFATAYSSSIILFTIMRFFVAAGHSGMGLTIYVLLVEVVGSQYRARYTIVSGFGWIIGYISLPALAYLVHNWYHLQLLITIPCLSFISVYWFLPESPRWLLSTGKLDKAIAVIETAARANDRHVVDLEEKIEKLYKHSIKSNEVQTSATVFDLLRTSNLRKKTLAMYFIWITIAFTYYGLSLNTNDLQGNVYWNFFLSGLMEIPATIFCLLTLDRYGRKKPFLCTLLLGGLACLICIFMKEEWWRVTTALAMCGKLFVSASFSIVYVYSCELFPTVARNVGVGSSSTMARIGSSLAPFMRDLGKVTSPAVPLALFGVLSLLSGFIVMWLPETNNFPVPETLYQAEEFGKPDETTSGKRDPVFPLKPPV